MNRYRTTPGLGPQKASANTVCQKCLKKDDYECKAAVQERPYVSRPSRTQQLHNPRLKPRLTDDSSNELLRREGIADAQLARAESDRAAAAQKSEQDNLEQPKVMRGRSRSTSSSDSVSTISTNRSKSRSRSTSPRRRSYPSQSPRRQSSEPGASPSPRKRKRRYSSNSRSPPCPREGLINKSRRRRSTSPRARGRSDSAREGRDRSRSRSGSVDRSAVTQNRRSMDSNGDFDASRGARKSPNRFEHRSSPQTYPELPPAGSARRKERSLSPYSRRLALTQAMNKGG